MKDEERGWTRGQVKKVVGVGVAVCIVILLGIALVRPAAAEWKPHYAEAPVQVQDWYTSQTLTPETQQRLKSSFKSCCGAGDTYKTRFRLVEDGSREGAETYEYWKNGEWRLIPPDIVQHKKTPDGRPVLFINKMSGQEVCFIIDEPNI